MQERAERRMIVLTAERRQFILDQLRRDGKVLASELSSALAVSEDTIRRDLRELAEAGLLQRVHGGALPRSPALASYAVRQGQAPQAKAAIAQAALQLLRNGQVLLLDGGTTTLQMAQHLPYDLQATVVTNSPPIAEALAEHPRAEVVLIGGRLFKQSRVVVGAAAVEAIRSMRADLCFLGVCSLHPEVGISVTDLEEAHTKRAMIAVSAEVVALADSEKLGTVAPYVVGPICELTQIITDQCVPETTLAPYRNQGVAILQG